MTKQILRVAAQLEVGEIIQPVTVREFLHWYDAERRGQNVVARIREDLEDHGLITVPDFEGSWIDGEITFQKAPTTDAGTDHTAEETNPESSFPEGPIGDQRSTSPSWVVKDPSHQISKLAAANQTVISVKPNDLITLAVTVMLMHDYSQLPVMTNERQVHGVITWRAIGHHFALKREGSEVRHAMNPAQEVRHDMSIFDVTRVVAIHDYVLIRDATNKVAGIVTATDLSQQFRNLSEPFLLLGEIENHIRNIIGERFTNAELVAGRDPGDTREVQSIADLTFGEYLRLIQNPDRWQRLGLAIDRKYFCDRLDLVRRVRNDVMHFDPDGIKPDQLRDLHEVSQALSLLQAR